MITDINKTSETEKADYASNGFFHTIICDIIDKILKPSEQQNTKMLVEVVLNNDPTASIGMISRYKLSMLESFHDV